MRRFTLVTTALAVCALAFSQQLSAQTFYPVKDGSIADGGSYGVFDGIGDDGDWTFNESGYEGSITLTTEPGSELEIRVFWEYLVNQLWYELPVTATLTFTVRGAPIFPFPDVDVYVYAYPSDLIENLDDFSSGPAVFQGSVTISPYQSPTEFSLDVSDAVNEVLLAGGNKVAFRFQVDPGTENVRNQAFIDALDSDPTTKPRLVLTEGQAIPGDVDHDGDVDLADLAALLGAYDTCLGDPNYLADADFDGSGCVDLSDLATLLANYQG